MATKIITVNVKVDADTMVSLKSKENLLKRISDLPQSDQERIIEICENPKALQGLADNWPMLLTMFS